MDENYEGAPLPAIGTHRARGVPGTAVLGYTEEKKPQLAAMFEIADTGERVPWYGYFTEKTEKRTLESLRIAGWSNDDLGDIQGFGDTEVDIQVEHNTWNNKTTARVGFVNRPGEGGALLKNKMSDAERKAFAAKMKGAAVKSRSAAPAKSKPSTAPRNEAPPRDDSDIPF